MKKTLHSALFSLFTSLAIIGSSSSSVMAKDVLLDKVVAVVNDRVILKSELTAKGKSSSKPEDNHGGISIIADEEYEVEDEGGLAQFSLPD